VVSSAVFSLVVFPATVAAATTTETVTNCNGSGPGSLFEVAETAGFDDTVTFSVSCPATSPIMLGGTINIFMPLTIVGPGASSMVVSGNDTFGIFAVSNVTISGLTIENGNADTGGGVLNRGSLTIADSVLSGNSAYDGGGAIYNDGTLTATNSSFVNNNTAGNGGGAIFNSLAATATVNGSTFSGNGTTGAGGAIDNDDGTLTVDDCSVSGNSASAGGAGIESVGTLSVVDSNVSSNSTPGYGGGVARRR
jgi:predicted outer membrane repeat protein